MMKLKRTISIPAIFVFILSVFSTHALAQEGKWRESRNLKEKSLQDRVFNPETVQTVSGRVSKVEKIRPMEGMSYGVHLLVFTGEENLSVHLGPAWFLEDQDMTIEVNDDLEIIGSRVNFEGKEAIIASSIKKGEKVLKLRDENGFPVWSGWKRQYRKE